MKKAVGVSLALWAGTFLTGVGIGIFARARYVAVLTAVLEVAAIAALVICEGTGHSNMAMLSGLAAMAVPFLGALATCGAFAASLLRRALPWYSRNDSL